MEIKLGLAIFSMLAVLSPSIPSGETQAAAPTQKWTATYDGPGHGDDLAVALAVDGSGNVYVAGTSRGTGSHTDFAVVKYSPLGVQLWAKRYDGPGHGDDSVKAIALDASGNVIVFGESQGSGTGLDLTTIKYDPRGRRLWVKRQSGRAKVDDYAGGLAVDGAGNVYVAGTSRESSIGPSRTVIKYKANGARLWIDSRKDPAEGYGGALAIAVDGLGNTFVAGWIVAGNPQGMAAFKYDAGGRLIWTRTYEGPASRADHGRAVALNDSGRVSVTGSSGGTGPTNGNTDWVTIGYDTAGKTLWTRRYPSPGVSGDSPAAIALDSSGNTFVTGWVGEESDYLTVKYGPTGLRRWAKRLDGRSDVDRALCLAVDSAGNACVAGESRNSSANYDGLTVKYGPNGNRLWTKRYNGPGGADDRANAIAVDASGSIYVAGESQGSGTGYDFVIIKY
jgi:hypothetical protein